MAEEKAAGAAAVFLDRDGTINHDLVEYIRRPEEFKLLEGVGEALRRLHAAGYKLVVITNQACLAKGLIEEKDLEKIHVYMEQLLGQEGVQLDGIYYCGDHPEAAVEQFRNDNDRRKPGPGMLLEAAEELGIDLSKSWMVGDATRDAEAGHRAGCHTILLNNPEQQASGGNQPPEAAAADFITKNLLDAANIIIEQDVIASEGEPAEAERARRPRPEVNIRHLLNDILRELRHQRVSQRHKDFPLSKMLAGMVQCGVFLCLVMAYVAFSYWGGNALWACLMVGLILQTMVVALLLAQR